mgnify:CR=1 FL=1
MPIFIAPFATVDGETMFTHAGANIDEATHLPILDTHTIRLDESLNTDNVDYSNAINKGSLDQISSN